MVSSSVVNIRRILLVLTFLETLRSRVGIGVRQDQAFIQTEADLQYLVEEMNAPIGENEAFSNNFIGSGTHEDDSETVTVLGSPIGFEPSELNFGGQPIGVPALRKVRIRNLNSESSIQMLSISGNTMHFHCSFFSAKVIPPLGNTTFDVVFLSREEQGPVENTLYIHTSAGSFRFMVRARGAGDPYRLRPITGIKLPLNGTYNRTISLYNPGPHPIQILEMISSGTTDLSLISPDGEIERPETSWSISPFTTKVLMVVKFFARKEKNYTAFIRIRTNSTGSSGKFLYVPFEALVVKNAGVFSPDEFLDFGTIVLNENNEHIKRDIRIYSTSLKKPSKIIQTIRTTNSFGLLMKTETIPTSSPDLISLAEVLFEPTKEGLYHGLFSFFYKEDSLHFNIECHALVVKGSITYQKNDTTFFYGSSKDFVKKNFTLSNTLTIPIKIFEISQEDPKSFLSLQGFVPVVLAPGESRVVLVVIFNASLIPSEDFTRVHKIRFLTDVYDLNVTMVVYDGKVQKLLPDSHSLEDIDFGSVGMVETREARFILHNPNPIDVFLQEINCTGCSIKAYKGGKLLKTLPREDSLSLCLSILSSEEKEGPVQGNLLIKTQYEVVRILFKFRVFRGSLTMVPSELFFDYIFPGETAELKLTVYSSFAQEMITNYVSAVPEDDCFSFEHGFIRGRNVILSVEKSFIGKVIFDPAKSCRHTQTCYVGFDMSSELGQLWLYGMNSSLLELEKSSLKIGSTLYRRYLSMLDSSFEEIESVMESTKSIATSNVTLSLDTNLVRGHLFRAQTRLIWPSCIQERIITFPLTQIGKYSMKKFILTNPSSAYSLYVDLLIVSSSESNHYEPFKIASVDSDELLVGIPSTREFSKAFILPPKATVNINFKFVPLNTSKYESYLYVRNNLTGFESASLFGEGSTPSFKLGRWKIDGSDLQKQLGALELEMKEKHLKGCCQNCNSKYNPPILTVKRSFKAKNTGQLPIWISGFFIDGYPCEGYGFKVLNCEPFRLRSKQIKEIEIAFSPDFTLSYISRTLSVFTSLDEINPLNYTLRASVPSNMLAACAAVLPRPSWETWIYHVLNIGMLVVSLGVVLTAFLDAERVRSIKKSHATAEENKEREEDESRNETGNLNRIDGLRHRRPLRRKSSESVKTDDSKYDKSFEIWSLVSWESLKRLLNILVPQMGRKSKNPKEHVGNALGELKPVQNTLSSSYSNNNSSKNKKKTNKKKGVEEADSSSTTTESSAVDDLVEQQQHNLPPLSSSKETQGSSNKPKADLTKKKNSKKNNKKSTPIIASSASEFQITPPETFEDIDFSQPVTKKTQQPPRSVTNAVKKSQEEETKKLKSQAPEVVLPSLLPLQPKQQPKKQQAKVKPNESSKGNRNSSPCVFDKPPRMLNKVAVVESSKPVMEKSKKVTPVGKILPEVKQSAGSQYGPIGAPRRSETKWESISPTGSPSTSQPMDSSSFSNSSDFVNNAFGSPGRSMGSSSFMQSLQAERRQRTEDFLLKNRPPVDWPGFEKNQNSLLESLWDKPEDIGNVWNGRQFGGTGVWTSGFWGPPQQGNSPRPYQNDDSSMYHQVTSFNNYDSLSSIWGGRPTSNERRQQQEQTSASPTEESWSSTLFQKESNVKMNNSAF